MYQDWNRTAVAEPPTSPAPRRRARAWAIGAVLCAVLAGAGGVGAYAFTQASSGSSNGSAKRNASPAPAVVTDPTTAQAASAVQSFLTAWSGADLAGAAQGTDDPTAAQSALQGYTIGLKASKLTFTNVVAGAADPAVTHAIRTAFHVDATLQSGGTFSYDGTADALVVNGKPVVHWAQSVLYPGLTPGQQLASGSIPATTAAVVDRNGTALTPAAYPSLAAIITALESAYAKKVQGSPGQGIEITDASGNTVKVLKVAKAATPGKIRTTLDASLQGTAEKAVKDSHITGMPADVVALDYRTGQILAVAFSGGGDAALDGMAAPGSTMKMITSAALIDKAGAKPSDAVSCPKTIAVNGQTFHNMDNESATGNTLTADFAMSCNTAFIGEATSKLKAGDLRDEAQNVFGIGNWKIGIPTTDGSVPAESSTNQIAAQAIGQGQVTMNPLAIASVAATIADSGFHQPILLPNLPQVSAARPISATTAAYIRQMMVATAQYGTAAPRMTGITGGAKTGTAETATGTNGWFAAYDGHIAVGALVVGGKQGVLSAGYVARDVLLAG
jgi:hypothetical protein